MSNISGQLIKDSYNYVLQSDLISGIVYRIGGSIAENPKFVSGLTVNANFTYSDGTEFPGYVLTCDAAGNAVWSPVSGATSGVVVTGGTFDYSAGTLTLVLSNGVDVPISGLEDIYVTGGVVSGNSIVFSYNDTNTFQVTGVTPYNLFSSYTASTQVTINNKLDTSGFTAYTATTQPLILSSVTGGTFSGGTLYLINNSGSTIPISGFTTGGTSITDTFVTGFTLSANTITLSQNRIDSYSSFTISLSAYTGSSVSGEYLPLSGGTVTGGTTFQSGLTANTISATTYYNLPTDVFVTGGTYTSGNAIFTNNTGGTFIVTGFAIGGGGSQPFYLNISQSKGSNRYLSTTASTSNQQSTGVTIANGATGTIASFQSDVLNATLIPGGIWAFYLHSYKSDTNASFNIFVEVYKRTSGGTETLLFTTDPTAVTTNSPNPSMQLSDAYFSGSSILVSDSVVARVRATNTSNQSHVITLFSEGSQHYSYAVSSIPTQQGLTCDTLSGCSIIQTIQTDVSNKYDKSGGTITGNVIVQNGLTANTISATTYQNLPLSGLTEGSNISITGSNGNFTVSFTGTTGSNFTGGTVSGATRFTGGLTANTISATTYQNLPSFTGGTVSGTTNFTNGLTANTITSYGKLAVNVSTVTDGVNSYSVYASLAPGEYDYMTNGIGGYFAVDARNGYNQITNKYSLQLIDGTEGLNKVLTSVTSDGKANWSGTLNVSAVTATTITSNGLTANTITSYGKLAVNVSTVTDGVNSYSVYASLSPGEYDYMTNGIGGYFAVDGRNGYAPDNKYSLQLIDETEGVGKVLTCVTSDGKANWVTPRSGGSDLYLFYNY